MHVFFFFLFRSTSFSSRRDLSCLVISKQRDKKIPYKAIVKVIYRLVDHSKILLHVQFAKVLSFEKNISYPLFCFRQKKRGHYFFLESRGPPRKTCFRSLVDSLALTPRYFRYGDWKITLSRHYEIK